MSIGGSEDAGLNLYCLFRPNHCLHIARQGAFVVGIVRCYGCGLAFAIADIVHVTNETLEPVRVPYFRNAKLFVASFDEN